MNLKNIIINRKKYDLSVIIPFYNVEGYLAESIESVMAQKGINIEILMVDDGSSDGSVDLALKYVRKNKNISLYRTNHKGPGGARNEGLKHARGKYIAFMDADDILVQGIYRRMFNSAESNDAELCICNIARFNSKALWSSDLHNKVYKGYKPVTHIKETPELVNDTCSVNKLIRRDFIIQNNMRFPENVVYEDISFNVNLHLKCNKVVMLAETGYKWRVRDEEAGPSLTQQHQSEKNVRDRFTASKWLVENVLRCDFPEKLKTETKYKLLTTDLKIILDSAKTGTVEECKKTFKDVISFVEKFIGMDALDNLPIVEIQRYHLVQNGDVEGFRKLIDYKWKNYYKAAVEERDGVLHAIFPKDYITIENRCLNDEFAKMQRRTWVDDIRANKEGLEIDAHLYIPRYNVSKPDDQEIIVKLINEETNKTITVKTLPRETAFITEKNGEIYDETTGIIGHYNYDWTGFTFKINIRDVINDNRIERLKYSVIAEYKDRIFSGNQIVGGVSGKDKKEFKSYVIESDKGKLYVDFGTQGELQIIVKRIKSNE